MTVTGVSTFFSVWAWTPLDKSSDDISNHAVMCRRGAVAVIFLFLPFSLELFETLD